MRFVKVTFAKWKSSSVMLVDGVWETHIQLVVACCQCLSQCLSSKTVEREAATASSRTCWHISLSLGSLFASHCSF